MGLLFLPVDKYPYGKSLIQGDRSHEPEPANRTIKKPRTPVYTRMLLSGNLK